ncbi:hypothetical protein, partial [Haliscomenobacter sp.]|uniref:hypothetical protein n=1 Tax=Haliscomenobacter sp. TaxID=2717303 RepID=UPI003364D056
SFAQTIVFYNNNMSKFLGFCYKRFVFEQFRFENTYFDSSNATILKHLIYKKNNHVCNFAIKI